MHQMKLPYGNSDFYQIITEKYLYFDRTDQIPLFEIDGKSLLFLRPRRFGKSLLVSMLENYYDLAKADQFERIFGHLAIGRNPTPLHNRYLILSWDFSFIKTYGTVQEIDKALHQYLNQVFRNFVLRYGHLLKSEVRIDPENALTSFLSLLATVQDAGHKIYLLIDEYDNFANEVMMATHSESKQRYEELVTGEGIFKTVFKSVKSLMRGMGLDRVFITGVSPIVLSDVTSGHNIAKNLTWRRQFNDLCGFTEAEVRPLVEQTIAECRLPPAKAEEAIELMRAFYNGSRFTFEDAPLIYNPTLVFYFLDEFRSNCHYPDKMLDGNLAPDHGKLVYISQHEDGEQLLLAAINDDQQVTVSEVGDRFGMAEMLSGDKRRDRMASLLCYLGVLTLGKERTLDGEFVLEIPNLVIRRLYVDRLLEMMLPAHDQQRGRDAARMLYGRGEMPPICQFIEETYFRVLNNRDYLHADEQTIKMAFLTLLYNDVLFIIDSEAALERTYADLTMIIRPEMRRFQLIDLLVEFKYVPMSRVEMSGSAIKQQSTDVLRALAPVNEKFLEAQSQLRDYQAKLLRKYGQQLRLRSFSVVAIGFERLLWEEVKPN